MVFSVCHRPNPQTIASRTTEEMLSLSLGDRFLPNSRVFRELFQGVWKSQRERVRNRVQDYIPGSGWREVPTEAAQSTCTQYYLRQTDFLISTSCEQRNQYKIKIG
ncbi:hypothetical protein J6590_082755 [Homalodisca vitripennis]|nr:hypothetical protein J6590_082755 [Homalodisca vitripennis]